MNSDELLGAFKEAFLRLNSTKYRSYVEVNYQKYLKHNKLVDNYTSQKMYAQYPEVTHKATPTGPQTKYEGLSADWFVLDEISLGHLDQQSPNKKGKKMYTETLKTVEEKRIDYLRDRLDDLFRSKIAELQNTFNLIDDETPSSAQELVDRILAGRYILPDPKGKRSYSYVMDQITWRDPSKTPDRNGYRKASEALTDARTAAEDVVMVGSPADGLAAVQALSKWTPTPTATVQ